MENSRDNMTTTRINNTPEMYRIERYRISWGAIIAGAIVSLMCETLLNFLGLGLNLSAFTLDGVSALNLGIGAIVWLVVSGIISAWICGWFTGKFSRITCGFERGCNGLVAWSLAMLITIMVTVAGAGATMGGVIGVTGHNSLNASKVVMSVVNKSMPTLANNESGDISGQNDLTQTSQDAAGKLGASTLFIFVALLLGAIASALGAAYCGKIKHEEYAV